MSAGLLSSNRRPVPLQMRPDLIAQRIGYQGRGSWVIKDPAGLKYHRLQEEQYRVLTLLDGRRSLEEVRTELKRAFPTLHCTLADVQRVVTDLHRRGLVYSLRPGQGPSLLQRHREERRKKMLATFRSLLFLRLPGWDPERTLAALYPLVKWVFRPGAVALAVALVVASWILLGVQFDYFRGSLPGFQQFFGWPNLVYLWFTLAVCKILHEFGHGLSCKHFGGECHEMGVMLLVFTPCLYCDASDSWMLRDKWKRIAIAAAGMYVEVVLAAIAVFVWWFTQPGLLHHLCLNVFFVTTITTVIFNANPLMRFDGYFMLSDWLEIPNLRPKADRMLRDKFAWYCLGIESRPDPFLPETGKAWFVLYAIAAWLYRWVILFGITLFLYTWLKPHGLQSIGIALAVVSLGGIMFGMLFNVYKIISAPRAEPMSRRKILASLAVLALLITAGLSLPLPLHVESVLLVQPHEVRHVYTITPGRLQELKVEPGQRVTRGDVLAILENEEKLDEHRALAVQRAAQEKTVERFVVLDDPAQERLAREKLQSIEEQLQEVEEQVRQLTVRAPCDGVVVAPPRVPLPDRDASRRRLRTWYGSPLEPRNRGCILEERTHLLSIGPHERMEAVLLVDQADRGDLYAGQTVELKFEHLPDRTYTAPVRTISERSLEYAPEPLSNKAGGSLATVTDREGRERLISAAYQATVLLEEDAHLLKPGVRGQARFLVARHTAGDWLWRYLRRTFHFRL